MQYFPIKEMPKDKKIKAAVTVISIAYLYRGQAYAALGRVDGAIEDYETVLRIDPENENGEKLIQFIKENSGKN